MRATAAKISIIALISLLSACSYQTKDELLPQTGPTMEEVYRNHQNSLVSGTQRKPLSISGIRERPTGYEDIDLAGYTRDANTEIEQQFPRLPNSTLVMYVYPHLSTDSRLPVPGYSTAFPFYVRPEYAMPGEM
ncbi:MAG TPA: TIGR03751 family conjugal transfer lipoprotein [Methylophaga aminisulfidivorans]|uniref:TIGR03751 family conjugal transfer lipoprotein n=2 Tax=root TaxID=1 RepID=A0A7C1W5D5_9GAMM|nr:TIGR03751 family conjugal transfer lipoprotein [Methylophaga sp.]HEC74276.1 TIGR03751 family conjugal transfer lipoprotein [Methylophaga aminisulfidivorans]